MKLRLLLIPLLFACLVHSRDRVTIHNWRNCDYQTELDYTNCWSDRTVDLSQIRAVDLFFINWGLRWMDHTIASFQFGDHEHIAFSVEPRYRIGQSYSTILGFLIPKPRPIVVKPRGSYDVIPLAASPPYLKALALTLIPNLIREIDQRTESMKNTILATAEFIQRTAH